MCRPTGRRWCAAPVLDDPDARLRTIPRGTDLLPPAWDFTDRLWLVDNTPDRRPGLLPGGRSSASSGVPGVSGRTVRSFLVSRDGTRYVAVVRGTGGDKLRAGRILVDGQGGVDRGRAEPHRSRSRAWTGPGSPTSPGSRRPRSSCSARCPRTRRSSRCARSPSTAPRRPPRRSRRRSAGGSSALAASADGSTTPYAVTPEELVDLDTGAAIPLPEGRVTSVDYVG